MELLVCFVAVVVFVDKAFPLEINKAEPPKDPCNILSPVLLGISIKLLVTGSSNIRQKKPEYKKDKMSFP